MKNYHCTLSTLGSSIYWINNSFLTSSTCKLFKNHLHDTPLSILSIHSLHLLLLLQNKL